MKRLWLLFVPLCLISGKGTQKPKLEHILKSNCFWDRTGDNQVIGGLNSCYRFLPDGQCYFYYYNFRNRKLTDSVYRYETDDVILPTTWSTMGDTVLIARGTHYKVIAVTKDSVTIEAFMHDTMVFRKNCYLFLEK